LVSACAWSNPANRPVWNAFEARFVPDDDGLFYASLPATVPLGMGAIVCDLVFAHPAQVVDDAWRDAAEPWRQPMDFEGAYYTTLTTLPGMVAVTPCIFSLSFLGRSVFDLPPNEPALTADEERAQAEEQARRRELVSRRARQRQVAAFAEWLDRGASRGERAPALDEWDASLDAPMARALAGDAADRSSLHVGMLRREILRIGPYAAAAALGDRDPVVRFVALDAWPEAKLTAVPDALQQALTADPVESVRLLARARFGR
jgi:hypothetical protein